MHTVSGDLIDKTLQLQRADPDHQSQCHPTPQGGLGELVFQGDTIPAKSPTSVQGFCRLYSPLGSCGLPREYTFCAPAWTWLLPVGITCLQDTPGKQLKSIAPCSTLMVFGLCKIKGRGKLFSPFLSPCMPMQGPGIKGPWTIIPVSRDIQPGT